jgi:hypothetical protein
VTANQVAALSGAILTAYTVGLYLLRLMVKDAVRKEFGKQTSWWIRKFNKLEKKVTEHMDSKNAHSE